MKTVAALKPSPRTPVTQRVKVGMIGLAVVLLIIGVAGAIFSTVTDERPIVAAGASRSDVVAQMAVDNGTAGALPANEPLAEMGVSPAVDPTPAPISTPHPKQAAPAHAR